MFCKHCGKEVNENAVICVHCGCALKNDNIVQSSSDKKGLIVLLLCFFLGPLGIHRFYLGQTGSGVAMLILSITFIGLIVSGIWAFVDLICILLGNYKLPNGETLKLQ